MDVVLGGGEGGFGVGSAVADAGDGGAVLLVEARIARAAPEAENLDFVFELVSAQPPTRRVYRFNGPCSEHRQRHAGRLTGRTANNDIRRMNRPRPDWSIVTHCWLVAQIGGDTLD